MMPLFLSLTSSFLVLRPVLRFDWTMKPSAWAFSISFCISASFFSSSIAFYLSAIFFMCLPMKPVGSALSWGSLSECKRSCYSDMISSRDCSFFSAGFFFRVFLDFLMTLDLALVLVIREAALFLWVVFFFTDFEAFDLFESFESFVLTADVAFTAELAFEVALAVIF